MGYRRIFSEPWLSDHAARRKNSACQYALAMWGTELAAGAMARLGGGRQSRGGSLAGITWCRRERGGVTAKGSLVPRLHLPNVWEVESLGTRLVKMTM